MTHEYNLTFPTKAAWEAVRDVIRGHDPFEDRHYYLPEFSVVEGHNYTLGEPDPTTGVRPVTWLDEYMVNIASLEELPEALQPFVMVDKPQHPKLGVWA